MRGDLWRDHQSCMIMGRAIQQFANNFPKTTKMNIYSHENCFNPYSSLFPHFSSFFYIPSLPQSSEASLKKPNYQKIRQICQYKMLEQAESPSFETRFEPSIIIQSNTELSHSETTKITPKKKQLTKPIQKKITQKESRNVASNLLRIFLKHTLQLRFYDRLIQKMINSRAMKCSVEEFRAWLLGFNINYKNYIRFTEIKRLFGQGQQQQMKAICRMLLRHYTKGVGAEHCLTSRRIEKDAVSMHLGGLRELVQQLMAK